MKCDQTGLQTHTLECAVQTAARWEWAAALKVQHRRAWCTVHVAVRLNAQHQKKCRTVCDLHVQP